MTKKIILFLFIFFTYLSCAYHPRNHSYATCIQDSRPCISDYLDCCSGDYLGSCSSVKPNYCSNLETQNETICCQTDSVPACQLCGNYQIPTINPTPGSCPHCYDRWRENCNNKNTSLFDSCGSNRGCCNEFPLGVNNLCETPGSQPGVGYHCVKDGGACSGSVDMGKQCPIDPDFDVCCLSTSAHTPLPTGLLPAHPTINIHEGCPNPKDITTALGCVPVDVPENFIGWLLQRMAGLGGGIAFLLVIAGGFKIMTSAGNPKGIQEGQEKITSALIGLLFIIFAVFLLELIGVKILGIPGLGI